MCIAILTLTFGTISTATAPAAAAPAFAVTTARIFVRRNGGNDACCRRHCGLNCCFSFRIAARRLLRTRLLIAFAPLAALTAVRALTALRAIAFTAIAIAATTRAMLVAITARALARTVTAAFFAFFAAGRRGGCRRGSGRGGHCRCFYRLVTEPAENFVNDGGLRGCLRRNADGYLRRGSRGINRRRRQTFRRQDAFDGRFLARCSGVGGGRGLLHGFRRFDHFVAGRQRFTLIQIVVTQPRHAVIGRFQIDVWDQRDCDPMARFELLNVVALFIQQERRHVHRYLGMHGGGAFFHRFFLQNAQDVQRGGFRAANMAGAMATRTRFVTGFP